ncbi:unnamed protein product, partial [Mesorhabditis belari]|uniref:Coatomer subunit epsilon n=1 Tax=Mesorhabditis belari TaxID=2138241 RepID=A0AAF3ELL8_9BILA
MAEDCFHDVRLHFYLGNYQQCINDAQRLSVKSEGGKRIRDYWIYRSMAAQKKYNVILANFEGQAAHGLIQPLLRLAEFHAGKRTAEEIYHEYVSTKNKWSEKEKAIYATIMLDAERPEEALRITYEDKNIELIALSVHAYILMNRFDKAEALLKDVLQDYEFHPLFQQAKGWLALAIGQDTAAYSDKETGALKLYSDLVQRYGNSVSLLIGKAASLISMGQTEEAETVLQTALSMDPQSVEANALLTVSASQSRLPTQNNSTRHLLKQLQVQAPEHQFVIDYKNAHDQIDKLQMEPNEAESTC